MRLLLKKIKREEERQREKQPFSRLPSHGALRAEGGGAGWGFVFFPEGSRQRGACGDPLLSPAGAGAGEGGGGSSFCTRAQTAAQTAALLPPQAALRLVDFSTALPAVPGAAGRGFRTHLFLAGSQEESKSSSP